MILVDDGSTDNSPQICDAYSVKDRRVKVIHQKNSGSVAARETGLTHACGKYISFIDSDDWIDDNMYDNMIQLAETNEADIVAVGFLNEDDNTYPSYNGCVSGIYNNSSLGYLKKIVLYTGEFFEFGIIPTLWSKLIRRELFAQIKMPDKFIKMGDDAALTYPLINRAECIVINNEFTPYHYRILSDSMSHKFDNNYFERAEKLIDFLENALYNADDMLKQLDYYRLFIAQVGIEQLVSPRNQISIMKKIRELKKILHAYNKLFMCQNVDWRGFQCEYRIEFEALYNKKYLLYFLLYYKRKLFKNIYNHIAR